VCGESSLSYGRDFILTLLTNDPKLASAADLIGLNDLHLSLGWRSHFEVLASDYLTGICTTILEAGLRLGVGGLGRAGDNDLPIPADLVYAQYPRLGAGAALVSRAFFRGAAPVDMTREICRLRENLDYMNTLPMTALQKQRERLWDMIKGQL